MLRLGRVREIVRYPVKSMAGIATQSAFLGWHGLAGDRRYGFRRVGEDGGFPWLSASRLPELILYQPVGVVESSGEPLPTHVRTPAGSEVALGSPELRAEISERFGSAVDLMKLKHGIFDEGAVSVIALATMAGIGREAGSTSTADASAPTSSSRRSGASHSWRTRGSEGRWCSVTAMRGRP
jgi:hypothetical protein